MIRRAAAVAVLLAACAAAAAPPRAPEAPPPWSELSQAQQQALAPLRADWPTLDAAGKQRWISVAARFPKMGEAERERVRQRMSEWARMSPAQRARARMQFQQSRQFSPEDRQASWEAYQALPDEQRRRLAERAGPKPQAARSPARSDSPQPKSNLVDSRREPPVKPVAPAVIQASPGATTRLMSEPPSSPPQHQAGLPKVNATEGFVNPKTLLPRRGPQGAAVRSPAASDSDSASASDPRP